MELNYNFKSEGGVGECGGEKMETTKLNNNKFLKNLKSEDTISTF